MREINKDSAIGRIGPDGNAPAWAETTHQLRIVDCIAQLGIVGLLSDNEVAEMVHAVRKWEKQTRRPMNTFEACEDAMGPIVTKQGVKGSRGPGPCPSGLRGEQGLGSNPCGLKGEQGL